MSNLITFLIAIVFFNFAIFIRTARLDYKKKRIFFIITNLVLVVIFIGAFLIKKIGF